MKQLKNMKETLVSATQAQLANLQNVNTKELGCAIDMIKDLSEAIYYCSIVKSMEEAQEQQKMQQPMMYYREPYPYYPERDQDRGQNRMYFSDGGGGNNSAGTSTQTSNSSTGSTNRSGGTRNFQEFQYYPNPYEGRSPERRRTYMESRQNGDKSVGMKELEHYAQELTSDIVEMMQDATAEEKQMLARKLTVLSNKIQSA